MKLLAALIIAAVLAAGQNTATTRDKCSPAISGTGGNVTITYQSNSCPQLNATTIAALKKFLAAFPKTADLQKTIARLNELLDAKDVELTARGDEVKQWIDKYTELEKQLAAQSNDSELSRRAAERLQNGDLEGAGSLLDEILSRGESDIDRIARDNFNRGRIFELEFREDRALEYFEKATRYRPDNRNYVFAFAYSSAAQNRHEDAIRAYEGLLKIYRMLAEGNPAAYQPDVAMTLNNLGNLYSDTQRLGDADKAYA